MKIHENGDDIRVELEEDDYTNRRQHLVDGLSAHDYLSFEAMSEKDWCEFLTNETVKYVRMEKARNAALKKAYDETERQLRDFMRVGELRNGPFVSADDAVKCGLVEQFGPEIEFSSHPVVIESVRHIPAYMDAQFQAWLKREARS